MMRARETNHRARSSRMSPLPATTRVASSRSPALKVKDRDW